MDTGYTMYQSPIFHHVILPNLMPGATYYYVVGSPSHGWSTETSFTMPGAEGGDAQIHQRVLH